MKKETVLEMRSICKSFGSVHALSSVSLEAHSGTIHALCGENGAGKSTLMKILAGALHQDSGDIAVHGEVKRFANPQDALHAGISMLYQELDLAKDLTVFENIFLGKEYRSKHVPFLIDRNRMINETQSLIDLYDFGFKAEDVVADLPQSKCQLVELLKAIHRNAKIIVMDEPTSSLSDKEARRLLDIVKGLREKGLTIIYISHRMDEVQELADYVSVLRDGKIVGTGPISEYGTVRIIKEMVGRELADFYPARQVSIGETLFECEHVSSDDGVFDVSFHVRKGEILGFAGLIGAGRTDAARAIFGVAPRTQGEIRFRGESLDIKTPRDAISHRIAFLTEDRKGNGLCLNLPCHWNVSLPNYETLGMKRFVHSTDEYKGAESLGERVKVKWGEPSDPVSTLSGGNQQKVLIARWLQADADVLIFDEPTRGIDVGAKREIYLLLNELAAQGKAIVVISSELPELFGICDRVMVMKDGRVVGEKLVSETTPEEIMHLATQNA